MLAWAQRVSLATLLIVSVSCTDDGGRDHPKGANEMRGCEPARPADDGGVQANAEDGEAHVLGLSPLPLPRDKPIKLVWRVTGSGKLQLSSTSPSGRMKAPIEGPTPHDGSDFVRPGEEWGSFFSFDEAGCWTIEVVRGDVHATVPAPVQ